MGVHLWKNQDFKDRMRQWGYSLDEKGFRKCIEESLKILTLRELAERLHISSSTIRERMKLHGIKNPNKAGGANNPYGIYGKSGKHRDRDHGMKHKEKD